LSRPIHPARAKDNVAAQALTSKQRFERANRLYTYFLLRPIGRLFLPWVVKLGITPNQVSLGTLVAILVGLALVATGGTAFALSGVLVVHIGLVLDNLDGDLARVTGNTSPKGEFLDGIIGYAYGALVLPAVGIGVARGPDRIIEALYDTIQIDPAVIAQVGLWAGIVFVLTRLVSLRFRVVFGLALGEGSGRLGRISLNLVDILPLLLVIGAGASVMSLVLVTYAAYYLAGLLYTTLASYIRAGSA
jgi:hypothetical protein